ncbi:MAG: hypothetical protein J6J43_07720 [Oscillospiraceae bacterium]|nr:hypothetical protein [Oscillospiraceae bacterium]
MLQYETAHRLFEKIREKASLCHTEGFDELYRDFLKAAVTYAETRLSRAFMTLAEKRQDDACYIALFLSPEQR